MRKGAKGIPFTDYAQKLILGKLTRFHELGYDPNDSLRESIERGWRGVFPQGEPKRESRQGRAHYSADDREYYKRLGIELPN